MSTSHLFAVYEVQVGHEAPAIPAFFIESTAPNNLDESQRKQFRLVEDQFRNALT